MQQSLRKRGTWGFEGHVVSVRSEVRMVWCWPWGWLGGLLLAGLLIACARGPLQAYVLLVADVLATVAGYVLVALVLGGALGRGRWIWRWVGRCVVGLLFLPVRLLRGLPRPRRERRVWQVLVARRVDGGQVLAVVPTSASGFHVRRGDVVRVWGRPWRGRVRGVAARNVTTGQVWGWTV